MFLQSVHVVLELGIAHRFRRIGISARYQYIQEISIRRDVLRFRDQSEKQVCKHFVGCCLRFYEISQYFTVFHSKDIKNLCKDRYGIRYSISFHGVVNPVIFFIPVKLRF